MNWYKDIKIAQQLIADISRVISKSDFERRVQMLYNEYKNYFDEDITSWQKWIQEDPYNVYLSLDSDAAFNRNYMQNISGDITPHDLVEAYLGGMLNDANQQFYQHTQSPIESTDVGERDLPWQAAEQTKLSANEARSLFQLASQRKNKSNESEVMEARKDMLLFYNTDRELSAKIGITDSELNKKIRSMVGFSFASKQLHEGLNENIPTEHQWSGMLNSSFVGHNSISPEDLDQFVKGIDVSEAGEKSYYGQNGESLRKYIATTFMAIDTRLSYDDLSFKIGQFEKKTTRGKFHSSENSITISDVNVGTVAHEIGHYLDYKFSRELYPNVVFGLSEMSLGDIERFANKLNMIEPKKEWYKKTKLFMEEIRKRGDISSAYLQSATETFARFIDKFTSWTTKKAGGFVYERDSYLDDNFSERDFMTWVRLLQEKSYVDSL